MRLIAVSGVLSTTLVAACGLGIVDVAPEPSPARLLVISSLMPDAEDPSRVRAQVSAHLDPGVGHDRTLREVAYDGFQVADSTYAPQPDGQEGSLWWYAETSFPSPGPEGIRLGLPQVSGLGLAQSLSMRVRVETVPADSATAADTVRLAQGEDLVIGAEPPSNPAENFDWSLWLTSASMPGYGVEVGGSESWPTEVRVPRGEIPAAALPVEARLRIRWDRALDLVELSAVDRYELVLESHMVVVWTVTQAD